MALRIKKQLFLTVLLLGCLIACKTDTGGNSWQDAKVPSTAPVLPSDATIGLSMYTLGAPYFVAQVKSIEERVEARGMKFIYTDAQDESSARWSAWRTCWPGGSIC
jgi:ABC-type sugar transport system substrate-binding protein